MSEQLPKIFAIGFNKCGTASLATLFKASGLETVHWIKRIGEKQVNVARAIHHNIHCGLPVLSGVDHFIAYTDLNFITREVCIEACMYYKFMYRRYPNAFFILNTRDINRWITSRFNHGNFGQRYAAALQCDVREVSAIWQRQFEFHHRDVRRFFSNREGQFLEFDIEKDSISLLSQFLKPSYDIDESMWRNWNRTNTSATKDQLGSKQISSG